MEVVNWLIGSNVLCEVTGITIIFNMTGGVSNVPEYFPNGPVVITFGFVSRPIIPVMTLT
jgi:hypothetical protein